MDGGLFCLCSDVTACCYDEKGVGLAVRVLEVEPAKEDGGCRNNTLAKTEFLAEFCDRICEINGEIVEVGWIVNVAEILGPSSTNGRAVDNPPLADDEKN